MKINLATYLPCSYEQAVQQVKTPGLLQHVAAPLVAFTPVDPKRFPCDWAQGTYKVKLRLFRFIPFGEQSIVISYPKTDCGFSLRDNGHSALIPTWDHTITILQTPHGVLYRDNVTIDAGIFTPIIWLFACIFYGHRQRRWHRLACSGFDYRKP
jgi:hypothetical protein